MWPNKQRWSKKASVTYFIWYARNKVVYLGLSFLNSG